MKVKCLWVIFQDHGVGKVDKKLVDVASQISRANGLSDNWPSVSRAEPYAYILK